MDELRDVSREEIIKALEESLALQCHYARLLNMYDGGTRFQFHLPQNWIDRLRMIKQQGKNYE